MKLYISVIEEYPVIVPASDQNNINQSSIEIDQLLFTRWVQARSEYKKLELQIESLFYNQNPGKTLND